MASVCSSVSSKIPAVILTEMMAGIPFSFHPVNYDAIVKNAAQVAAATEGELTRIYTRTGDDGTTSLVGGHRVSKNSPTIETIGDLDELSALIGVVCSHELPPGIHEDLQKIQKQLFIIGKIIATPADENPNSAQEQEEDLNLLRKSLDEWESSIDLLTAQVPPLQQFILPGGSKAGAHLHLARTVTRRAERRCATLIGTVREAAAVVRFMNRLSDVLFILARFVNHHLAKPEKNLSDVA